MSRIDALVQEFADGIAAQTEAMRVGDSRSGNRHAKRYVEAFQHLRELGVRGREALVPLLAHEQPDVRGMTAAFLLRYKHEQARAVLETLATGQGFVAFGAGETLKRWADGTWALDPE